MPVHFPRRSYSLSAKLIAGFLLVTVPALSVMVAISLYALRDLTSVNRQLQEISHSVEAVQGLDSAVARATTPLSAYIVDSTPEERRRFETAIGELEALLKGCGGAACHGSPRQPKAMAESLVPSIQGIKDRAASIFAVGTPSTEQDKVRVLHEINQRADDVNGRLHRMASTLLLRVASLQDESQDVSRKAAAHILLTVLLVFLLAATATYLLSRRLLGNISGLLAGTRHIMQGDLGYRVAVAQRDEIGQLAESFNAMAQEIQEHREHLTQIVEARTAELRQAQDSLIQSEKLASIGLLASGVAHELNNPLTSILMNVSLLMEDCGDRPVLKAELQRISEDTARCKRIIDDLRDFSRRHDLDIVPTDLNRLVRDALGLIAGRTESQRITVGCALHEPLPLIPCDTARMEQVLVNIFVNAVQAMPEGGRLTVTTGIRAGCAEISVEDTGTGIADEVRGRIFDPFFTTKPHGTGLGLSIVYRIMEAHGGSIDIGNVTARESAAKVLRVVGTRVLLLLPLRAEHAGIGTMADH